MYLFIYVYLLFYFFLGTLCLDSYSLTPLKFEKWEGHEYSVSNKVEIKGKEWWLEVQYDTISSGPNPGGRGLNLLVFEQVCFKRNRKKEKSKEWQIETTKVTIKRSKKIQAKEQQNRREREKLNDLF